MAFLGAVLICREGKRGEGTPTKVLERLGQGPGKRGHCFQKRLRESGTGPYKGPYRKDNWIGKKKGGKVWLVVARDHVWQKTDVTDSRHSLYSILPCPSHETSSEIPYAHKKEQSDIQSGIEQSQWQTRGQL